MCSLVRLAMFQAPSTHVSSGCHIAQHRTFQWRHCYWTVWPHNLHTQGGKKHFRTWNTTRNIKLTFNILTYRPLKYFSPKSLYRWAISLLSVGTGRENPQNILKYWWRQLIIMLLLIRLSPNLSHSFALRHWPLIAIKKKWNCQWFLPSAFKRTVLSPKYYFKI